MQGASRLVVALFVGFSTACSASEGGSGGATGSGATSGAGGGGGAGGTNAGGTSAGGNGGGSSSGKIGAACTADTECTAVAGSTCYTTLGIPGGPSVTFPGGFCSKVCDAQGSGDECGDEAGCASIGQSGGRISTTLTMCTPPCASDTECRSAEGYKCLQILPGIGVCTPP